MSNNIFVRTGLLSDASTCYDRAIQSDPSNAVLKKGLLKIRLAHGELNSVLNLANGMINNELSHFNDLKSKNISLKTLFLQFFLEPDAQQVPC